MNTEQALANIQLVKDEINAVNQTMKEIQAMLEHQENIVIAQIELGQMSEEERAKVLARMSQPGK